MASLLSPALSLEGQIRFSHRSETKPRDRDNAAGRSLVRLNEERDSSERSSIPEETASRLVRETAPRLQSATFDNHKPRQICPGTTRCAAWRA